MEAGVVVEQAPPDAFFSAPREARTQAFLHAILPH
jgi:ABC-type polar amino acid transport system ATPase subunit